MDQHQHRNLALSDNLCDGAHINPQRTKPKVLLDALAAYLHHIASSPADFSAALSNEAEMALSSLRVMQQGLGISLADLNLIRVELERLDPIVFKMPIEACQLYLGLHDSELPDLAVFRDCLGGETGPEMVVIPTDRFMMGSPESEPERDDAEGPHHEVRIAHRYSLARYPVTFEEYDRFCRATGRMLSSDRVWGRGRLPAINVVWEDAVAYCEWLSNLTEAEYRLPSEAEWENACRAGTSTPYPWGSVWEPSRANGSEGGPGRTTLVGSYPPNDWGLYDMIGNIREWVRDSWHDSYEGAPTDGSAWEGEKGDRRVVRGGAWFFYPRICRAAFRFYFEPDVGVSYLGFRPARTLP